MVLLGEVALDRFSLLIMGLPSGSGSHLRSTELQLQFTQLSSFSSFIRFQTYGKTEILEQMFM